MYELTTLNVLYRSGQWSLLAFAAEPVEKPDARFLCVRLGIVSRHRKVNAFRSIIGVHSVRKLPCRDLGMATGQRTNYLFAGNARQVALFRDVAERIGPIVNGN